ncbi:hypothetical protein DAPPUDRAFT_108766 [Daphnia pulex]|uniref:Uncharacterized protein n=1 Tax=Daphnia pulex TaxID=6669 RepID=E9H142_DAPPU|nr:hypothetical protein DAPPUDRAFT_108766 [Daphnia pulex]|eukprot:EFX74565.1 hypothetical protein DAPPUDRAFT_108766 [Daphnia pulex]
MDEKPEEPSPEIVSKPKETPAEKDDTGNVTNKDQQVLGETKLLEIAKETIIPEVEQQQTKAKSKTTDHQPRLITKDPHALPPNPEKSQHPQKQNGTMDEKPEAATEPLPDCEEENQTALEPKETIPAESNKECPPPEAEEVDKAARHVEIIIRRPVNFPEANNPTSSFTFPCGSRNGATKSATRTRKSNPKSSSVALLK